MADFEEQIDRASSYIEPDVLHKLVSLMGAQRWLENLSKELAELWNLCGTGQQERLLEDLIRRYRYIDSALLKSLGDETAKHICEVWGLSESNSLIVATSDNPQADGSQAFIQSLKNKFVDFGNWKESNFINRIQDSLKCLHGIHNVVLVDDFIGTGNTIARRINWYRKKLQEMEIEENVKLYTVAIGAMEFSKSTLNTLNMQYFSPLWLKKGISEVYKGTDLTEAVSSMQALEENLEPTISNGKSIPNFGYLRSEALFALESYNVPNNVFPVFWWPMQKPSMRRKTLFKRLL